MEFLEFFYQYLHERRKCAGCVGYSLQTVNCVDTKLVKYISLIILLLCIYLISIWRIEYFTETHIKDPMWYFSKLLYEAWTIETGSHVLNDKLEISFGQIKVRESSVQPSYRSIVTKLNFSFIFEWSCFQWY